jgi:ABC-type multidrug transport system fused ATPase/permease subunit
MKSLLALFPYIKKYKSKTLWGCVFVLLSNGFDSIYPLIIGAAIDSLKEGTLKYSLLTFALAGSWVSSTSRNIPFSYTAKSNSNVA